MEGVCSVAWVSGRADWNGCAVWLEPGVVLDGTGVQCGLSLASLWMERVYGCAVWLEPGVVLDGRGVHCGLSLAS
jgi:hypothetical protein